MCESPSFETYASWIYHQLSLLIVLISPWYTSRNTRVWLTIFLSTSDLSQPMSPRCDTRCLGFSSTTSSHLHTESSHSPLPLIITRTIPFLESSTTSFAFLSISSPCSILFALIAPVCLPELWMMFYPIAYLGFASFYDLLLFSTCLLYKTFNFSLLLLSFPFTPWINPSLLAPKTTASKSLIHVHWSH